eukprot:1361654-Rhodomonas_salina.1
MTSQRTRALRTETPLPSSPSCRMRCSTQPPPTSVVSRSESFQHVDGRLTVMGTVGFRLLQRRQRCCVVGGSDHPQRRGGAPASAALDAFWRLGGRQGGDHPPRAGRQPHRRGVRRDGAEAPTLRVCSATLGRAGRVRVARVPLRVFRHAWMDAVVMVWTAVALSSDLRVPSDRQGLALFAGGGGRAAAEPVPAQGTQLSLPQAGHGHSSPREPDRPCKPMHRLRGHPPQAAPASWKRVGEHAGPEDRAGGRRPGRVSGCRAILRHERQRRVAVI